MSPRRSSRARTTQPSIPGPEYTNSSTSSISSGRAERSTRSHHKPPSPKTPNPLRSLSREDVDEPPKPHLRRTRSGNEEIKDISTQKHENEEEEEGDEEEVTRCICGHSEYPGLPTSVADALRQLAKDSDDVATSSVVLPEDIGGLFIQCDICKVWQHGGCVSILNTEMSPEEYFCEQCRKGLHKLATAANGQKYSRYLPVQEAPSPPASPELSPREGSSRRGKESKASRPSAEALAHKRRSTMNSRDAAYDEAEQLRMAIEASKRQGGAFSVDSGSRRNKRSRSDSEERKDSTKRQRTNSHSSSSPSMGKINPVPASSSDEALATLNHSESSPRKIRGAAARNHREKEQRELREKERAEAAGRRAARSERRRDSEPSDETQPLAMASRPSDTSHDLPPSPDTPPASQDPAPRGSSHKKTGRPTTKRSRAGRNQYTKDREPAAYTHARNGSQLDVGGVDTPLTRGRSRSRSTAGDTVGRTANGLNSNGQGGGNGHPGDTGKPSKPKQMHPIRTSLNEMKRRVAGIMEFVSRTQSELKGREARTPPVSGEDMDSAKIASAASVTADSPDEADTHLDKGNGLVDAVAKGLTALGTPPEEMSDTQFADLTSTQMISVLTGRLVGWQKEFGVWGEK